MGGTLLLINLGSKVNVSLLSSFPNNCCLYFKPKLFCSVKSDDLVVPCFCLYPTLYPCSFQVSVVLSDGALTGSSDEGLNIWIIIGAILGAIALFLILVLILWKVSMSNQYECRLLNDDSLLHTSCWANSFRSVVGCLDYCHCIVSMLCVLLEDRKYQCVHCMHDLPISLQWAHSPENVFSR